MEIFGVQKENSTVRIAALKAIKGDISIQLLETSKGYEIIPKDSFVVTGINGQDLLIRHLTTPLKKIRALEKTLPFQLEALIPYSINEVMIKPIYTPKNNEMSALFFTVSKVALSKHIENFQAEGIDPAWVSAIPMALYRFAKFIYPEVSSLVVFYMGKTTAQLVSIENEDIISHLTLHAGIDDFDRERFLREVDRAFCFLEHKEKKKEEWTVLFCGERANEIEELVCKHDKRALVPLKLQGHRGFDGETVRPYAVPIGLALDALKNDRLSIQFRQESFIANQSFVDLKNKLIRGGILAGALFCSLMVSYYIYFRNEEKKLIEYTTALTSSYANDLPALKKVSLEKQSIEKILAEAESALKLPKKEDAYFSVPPKVSDVLVYLSTHPKLEDIEIKKIDYELKHYPSLQHPKEKYQAKVYLVFSSPEAKKAREFHDAIVDDEKLVDSTQTIEWNRNENEYEIAFFLRS